jgi:haloacetate dehalogenase
MKCFVASPRVTLFFEQTMELSPTHHTVTVNGLKMHYVEIGKGPPVVLLHGFPETWYAWRHQLPILAKHCRAIAPDLRGYGETQKPSSGYEKKTMARDILGLMHHLGTERAAVIGHDRGARVALRLAKDFPEAVSRFAALDNIPTRTIFERMNTEISTHPLVFPVQCSAGSPRSSNRWAGGDVATPYSIFLVP